MRVAGSRSKADNLNAALARTSEPVIGFLDADARPDPHALRLAANWIDSGWHFVQGSNLVSGPTSRLVRAVAAEFAAKYFATYAGRFAWAQIAYFSGSNGYWAGDVVRALQFDRRARVEDIDCAVRALLQGRRLAFDPAIRCSESAPASWSGLWNQRLRWAGGWAQLTGRYFVSLARTNALSGAQRAFWLHATGWRRALVPSAALVLVGEATYESVCGRQAFPIVVGCATALLSWLAGLAQACAAARQPDRPAGLLSPAVYGILYVLAEAARLCASVIVLAKRPPWIPTPRPSSLLDR